MVLPPEKIHPAGEGEQRAISAEIEQKTRLEVDTFDGKVFVDWDPEASVTPLGQLAFFIEFLKTGGRFESWVEDCPLIYQSPNAPRKVDVLGSLFLSVLSGHTRYAHLSTLIHDGVNARLLGMNKVVSDDSARRALYRMEEAAGIEWMQTHLQKSYEPLLKYPWILDCDVTVKPLYGHQAGAEKGYNPKKRGRPSHTYHSYFVANLRLLLEVEVQAGNQSQSCYSAPGLLALLERLPRACWPAFVRGDCDWGSDPVMRLLEARGMPYLFKLKQSKYVKELIYRSHYQGQWIRVNGDWEVKEDQLQLSGWSQSRRVVMVRRRLSKNEPLLLEWQDHPQQRLAFIEEAEDLRLFEYSVLVTALESDPVAIFHHYRDRADCENVFDEIKNQWGWGGYVTRALKPCRLMARIIALIYNWWTLFVRLLHPSGHLEAITSRPLLLTGVGRLTESGRQKRMIVTSVHGKAEHARSLFQAASRFFSELKANAPQLNLAQRWEWILTKIAQAILPEGGAGPPLLAMT